jgi:hypothetical protein
MKQVFFAMNWVFFAILLFRVQLNCLELDSDVYFFFEDFRMALLFIAHDAM